MDDLDLWGGRSMSAVSGGLVMLMVLASIALVGALLRRLIRADRTSRSDVRASDNDRFDGGHGV